MHRGKQVDKNIVQVNIGKNNRTSQRIAIMSDGSWNWIDDILKLLTDEQWKDCGNFAGDVGMALKLPIADTVFWVISTYSVVAKSEHGFQVMLIDKDIPQFKFVIQGDNLPECIGRAWLDWYNFRDSPLTPGE